MAHSKRSWSTSFFILYPIIVECVFSSAVGTGCRVHLIPPGSLFNVSLQRVKPFKVLVNWYQSGLKRITYCLALRLTIASYLTRQIRIHVTSTKFYRSRMRSACQMDYLMLSFIFFWFTLSRQCRTVNAVQRLFGDIGQLQAMLQGSDKISWNNSFLFLSHTLIN